MGTAIGTDRQGGEAAGCGAAPGWRRMAGALAWVVLLAGCGPGGPFAPTPLPAPQSRAARPPARLAPPRPAPAVPLPNLPATEAPPTGGGDAVPGTQADAPPPPAVPTTLAGLSAGRVEALMGQPMARSASGTGERWRYAGPDCTIELFLFPGVGSGGLVVLDRRATGATERECLRRMRDGGA
jgi:hypothetical protein